MSMNITEEENRLFDEWIKERNRNPFIKDGSPSPETYLECRMRTIFILKDANFGLSEQEQNNCYGNDAPYDQRVELRDNPDVWWKKVSNWCSAIIDTSLTWPEILGRGIRESLAPFAFIQMKKNAGGGSVKSEVLWKIATEDRGYIKKQISIYQPQFIVCCGVGSILYKAVFEGADKLSYTSNGVGYWRVPVDWSAAPTYLIDYCHPSARFGKKLEGVVALGLQSAIAELRLLSQNVP